MFNGIILRKHNVLEIGLLYNTQLGDIKSELHDIKSQLRVMKSEL